MKENWPLLVWWALITLIGGTPHIASATLPTLSASEWAAWVQAIGSVAAIIVSAYLAIEIPARHEAQQQMARQARILLSIPNHAGELTGYAAAAQKILKNGRVNGGTFPHIAASIRASESDLNSLSVLDIPSSARLLLIATRANANIMLMLLDHAHSEMSLKRRVAPDYFDQVAKATIVDERRIRDYIAARPIGRTPLPGYH